MVISFIVVTSRTEKMAFSKIMKMLFLILISMASLAISEKSFQLQKCCENSKVFDTTTKTCVQSHLSLEELDAKFPLNLGTEKVYSRNDPFVSGQFSYLLIIFEVNDNFLFI